MITHLTHVTLYVLDQNKALDFYVNKIGLKVHSDATFEYEGKTMRWLTLHAAEQSTVEIVLRQAETEEEKKIVGKQVLNEVPLFCFATNDCHATYQALVARGVVFTQEPTEQFWGIEALCVDLYGNIIDIVQPLPH